jgi:hypothetical protein
MPLFAPSTAIMGRMSDSMPPEALLADFPDEIRAAAETLRAVVRRAVPDSIERVRGGWRLIGYEAPAGRRSRYFAYIAPEPIHVHLGFEYGAWMADPDGLLEGAHLGLKKVRFTTFTAGQPIPTKALEALTREAVRVSQLSREERVALAFDRGWEPWHSRRSGSKVSMNE